MVQSWFRMSPRPTHSWSSSVSTFLTTDLTEVRSPAEAMDFFPLACVQTGSEAHPASYPMGTSAYFPEG
jgi:hypothetical protein